MAPRGPDEVGLESDTLTAIAGSIAEGFYGVPEKLKKECMNRLPADLRTIVKQYIKIGMRL